MDHLGGIDTAIALVKRKADIPDDEEVTVREVSVDQPSLQQALASGGASSRRELARLLLSDPAFVLGTFGFAIVPLLLQVRSNSFTSRFQITNNPPSPPALCPRAFHRTQVN